MDMLNELCGNQCFQETVGEMSFSHGVHLPHTEFDRAAGRSATAGAGRKLGGDSPSAAAAGSAAVPAGDDSAEERRRMMAEAADARMKAMGA